MIGIIRELRMALGETLEAIGVTALAFFVAQKGNIIQAAPMLDMTVRAGEISRYQLLTGQTGGQGCPASRGSALARDCDQRGVRKIVRREIFCIR